MRPHGTTTRYQRYGCRCPACRDAQSTYMRDYRRRNPKQARKDRLQVDAYRRAEARLRELHRDDFDRFYDEELERAGLR